MTLRRLLVLSALVCPLSLAFGPAARAADINGAWAHDKASCNQIYVKRNGQISFTEDADLHGTGFIIEANRIRGKLATCSIKKRKDDGSTVHLIATCSTDVAVETIQFSLKIDSDSQITRLYPGVPELDTPYQRCPL